MIPKKLYVRELDIDIFDQEVNLTRAWVANKPCTGRREYADLSQVWHPAEEEPEDNRYILTCEGANRYNALKWLNTWLTWRSIARIYEVKRWAYIEDLLPKGGVK